MERCKPRSNRLDHPFRKLISARCLSRPYLDEEDSAKASLACFGCNVPFPEVDGTEMGVAQVEEGISPTGRYRSVAVLLSRSSIADTLVAI